MSAPESLNSADDVSEDGVVSEGEVAQDQGRNGEAAAAAAAAAAGGVDGVTGAEGRNAGSVQLGLEDLRKVRVVLLKKADVKSIAAVLRASRKLPQLRFVLLLDDINVRVRNWQRRGDSGLQCTILMTSANIDGIQIMRILQCPRMVAHCSLLEGRWMAIESTVECSLGSTKPRLYVHAGMSMLVCP